MTRHVFIFVATFIVGALLALITRAALYEPHAGQEAGAGAGGDYAPMVSNPLTPATSRSEATVPPTAASPSKTPPPASPDAHAGHVAPATPAAAPSASDAKPVNTVCAICGMPVDPTLPTAKYQGKVIGFGCKMCPPKFKADPDRYGPAYLNNEVIKR